MTSKPSPSRICLCLALVLSLIASEALGQDPDRAAAAQWAHVQLLSPGVELEVRGPKKIKGKLSSVTSTAIVVVADGQVMNLSRSEIREIKVRRDSVSSTKGAIAAGIGAASGLGTAAILDGALTDGNGMSKTAALNFTFIGAIVGFLWGTLRPEYRTVYKVR